VISGEYDLVAVKRVGCTPEWRRATSMSREGLRYHTRPDLPFPGVNYMTKKHMLRYHIIGKI